MMGSSNGLMAFGLMAAIVLVVSGAIAMLWDVLASRRLNARVGHALAATSSERPSLVGVASVLERFGEWLRRFYKAENIEHLRGVIQASGFNPHQALPLMLAGKFLVTAAIMAAAAAAAALSRSGAAALLIISLGGMVGVMGPELILAAVRRRFAADLRRGTPGALDLLVVCSEAGMGLEGAIERIALETRASNRAMASVLSSLLDDLRVLPNPRDAFANLGARSGVEGLHRVGTMLSQSLQYGTPLSRAMRAVAEELRRERMNRLEENAVKLPAKLIFPLILFIMPSLYIVLLGPSFMGLFDSLRMISSSMAH
jgi:tight adherence protein C